jgi:hypothetical protein
LINSEIGAKKSSGRGAAVLALVLVCGYEAGRYLLHRRAIEMMEARIYDGQAPERVIAVPGPFNPLRWTGIVETSGFYSIHDLNLLEEFDPSSGRVLTRLDAQPAIVAARKTETIQRFLSFSQAPYWRAIPVDEPQGGFRVEVMDLRFGQPPKEGFVASALVDGSGRVVDQGFRFGLRSRY